MVRLLPLVLVCALSGAATADGFYLAESLGGTDVADELDEHLSGGFRVKLGLGMRRGRWAIEAWLADTSDLGSGNAAPCRDCAGSYVPPNRLMTYGLDVKYLQRIAPSLELYLRGGLSRGMLRARGLDDDFAGRGLGIGAGVQLKGKVRALGFLAWPMFFMGIGPKVTAAVFLDAGHEFYRLHSREATPASKLERASEPRGAAIDAKLTSMTLGFAVGSDF